MDEPDQAREHLSEAGPALQQPSGSVTTAVTEEAGDSTDQDGSNPAGGAMEKNYTDTIESLLSELWKERLVSCMQAVVTTIQDVIDTH